MRCLLVPVILSTACTAFAADAETRKVIRRYSAGWAGPVFSCDVTLALGGACMYAIPGEFTVSFSVTDDRTTAPIGGWYGFRHTEPPTQPTNFSPFCGRADSVPILEQGSYHDRVQLVVVLDIYYSAEICDLPAVPTTGVIEAEFSGSSHDSMGGSGSESLLRE